MFAPRAGPPLLLAAAAIGALALLAVALGVGSELPVLAGLIIAGALWAFFAQFLRDPARPVGPDIVAPADGRVQLVTREGDRWRIAVFMSVTDVHVNRFPMDARVVAVDPAGQGHAPAYRDGAASNVQRRYRLATALGEVELVQITGVLARRLVSFVAPGDRRSKGDRLGMIVLGSRVDLLLPTDRAEPVVRPGDRVRAGATPIARERS